jgi:hypothetical protein
MNDSFVLSLINSTLPSEYPSVTMLSWAGLLSEMMLSDQAAPGRAILFVGIPDTFPHRKIRRRLKVDGVLQRARDVSGFSDTGSGAL